MKQITNVYENTCNNCHNYGRITTLNKHDTELSVCYHCGNIIHKQAFDSRAYINDLVEDGIDDEWEIVNILTEKLCEVYECLDEIDVDALAGLLVKNLYDEIKFEVEAEAADNTERIHEREAARIGES